VNAVALVAIGAAVAIAVVALTGASVAVVVAAHERRDVHRFEELRRNLDDLRRVLVASIAGREELAKRIDALEAGRGVSVAVVDDRR